MKKKMVIISLVSIFILMSAVLSGCYGKSMEELTGYDSYVSAEYGETADNPWKPVGPYESLGNLKDGDPVYGFEGDINRFYIYIGNPRAKETQIGRMCRNNVEYPDIKEENIDSIEFILAGKEPNSNNTISDQEHIKKVLSIISDQENIVSLGSGSDLAYDYANRHGNENFRIGKVIFYNNDLPGLAASMTIIEYQEDLYYVIDAGETWLCVKDNNTIVFD